MLYVILAVVGIIVIAGIVMYNSFVSLRNKVNEAFSTMDVYMKKRFDIIPNLVSVVKGYAGHESEVLQKLTETRANATNRNEQLSAEANITKALDQIMVTVEKYPDLKANQNFLELQEQLVQIENDIASARRYYNGSVREMNTSIQSFPNNLIAGMFGFKAAPMFEAKDSERQVVSTEF